MGQASTPPTASILLVDDETANLAELEAALRPLGQRLLLAGSGREALDHLRQEDVALILLDVRLPDMDGFETAALVRAQAGYHSTPIMFVTAFPDAEHDLQRAYGIGAADVIFKPFVPEFLRSKVSAFVDLYLQQRSIRDLLVQAQDSSRAKSEFLNMAAHELRTPLAVVVGYLSMLADGTFGPTNEDVGRVLQIVNQKGVELNTIVDGLLTASRLEAGTQPERSVEYDLREAARQAVKKATPQAELLAADLLLELPELPVMVLADPSHLARIVDNLVNNALAYSMGRPWVKVAVQAGPPPALTVEDRGVGIAREEHERVFERFVRLEGEGETLQPGTGLGLYISRELARRLGGDLEVAGSEPGRGSTLALRLRSAH